MSEMLDIWQLREKISKMEEANLGEKPWQLSGEIGATDRPENSLLEEHLMYDQTVKLGKCLTIILISGE